MLLEQKRNNTGMSKVKASLKAQKAQILIEIIRVAFGGIFITFTEMGPFTLEKHFWKTRQTEGGLFDELKRIPGKKSCSVPKNPKWAI